MGGKRKRITLVGAYPPVSTPTPQKPRRTTLRSSRSNPPRSNISTPTKSAIRSPSSSASKAPSFQKPSTAQKENGAPSGPFTTPTHKRTILFETPTKPYKSSPLKQSTTIEHNADRSARRRSARTLLERAANDEGKDEDELDDEDALANAIRDETLSDAESAASSNDGNENEELVPDPSTPSKRPRGRPKSAVRKRTPTPPPDLPPHELYFFHNRPSSNKTSSNTLSSFSLLSHGTYHDQVSTFADPHLSSQKFLHEHHTSSFSLWHFSLTQGFSMCLYGYGSKRRLLTSFAKYLYARHAPTDPPITILVNGTVPGLTLQQILLTVHSALSEPLPNAPKLPPTPSALLPLLLTHLSSLPSQNPLYVLLSSLSSSHALRAPATQSLLANLAAHPKIHLIASCDHPCFPLLWTAAQRETFNWVFHDATTFLSYDNGQGTGEVGGVVDAVHELMGRKGKSAFGGREGVGWVLKSLSGNARGVYKVLLEQVLAGMDAGIEEPVDEDLDDGAEAAPRARRAGQEAADGDALGIEFRTLYKRAEQEFLCSSEGALRQLLKEFEDHQMVSRRRDGVGGEVIGVGEGMARRELLEGILEDLGG